MFRGRSFFPMSSQCGLRFIYMASTTRVKTNDLSYYPPYAMPVPVALRSH